VVDVVEDCIQATHGSIIIKMVPQDMRKNEWYQRLMTTISTTASVVRMDILNRHE
jgi:hypothetical protein